MGFAIGGQEGGNGAAYVVKPGNREAVYSGMSPYGLGKVGKLVPASENRDGARSRMKVGGSSE